MPNGHTQERPEPQKFDADEELARAEINLHNAKFQVQLQEAIVKKLQELVKQ